MCRSVGNHLFVIFCRFKSVTCHQLVHKVLFFTFITQRKPPPTPKFQAKVIRDSNPDFWINPDLDVCRISPKMLWMHYLVGVINSAKYGTNQALFVKEMPTHVQKSPIPQW